MKKFRKIICGTLALLMLSACIAGCGNKNKGENEKDASGSQAQTEEGKTYGEYDCELPSGLNYGDREITILSRDAIGQSDEFVSDGISDNLVLRSVYLRNGKVETTLGVKLNCVSMADDTTNNHATVIMAFQTDVLAQTGTYDIVAAPLYTMMPKVVDGIYYNLREMDYINLGKYYWAQGFNEWAEFGGAQYMATGAVALSLYRFMYVTVYNNDFFADNGLEDIYDLVKKDEWTAEKQYKMISDIYKDDGTTPGKRDEQDTYGFVSGARTSVDAYNEAWKLGALGRDNDGGYAYIGSKDKPGKIADKMLHLFYDGDGSYIVPTGKDNTDNAIILSMFKTGKVAMATMKINTLETGLRNQEFEYSIAPLPKYDENQDSYGTYIQDQVTALALPVTTSEDDVEMMGAVMECLASESYKQTYTAYFENALSYQYLQNPESVEMLKLIYESVGFSAYFTCYATEIPWNVVMRNVASMEFNTVSSQLDAYGDINKRVAEYNQKLRELIAGSTAS